MPVPIDKKISQLDYAGALTTAHNIPISDGGQTLRVRIPQGINLTDDVTFNTLTVTDVYGGNYYLNANNYYALIDPDESNILYGNDDGTTGSFKIGHNALTDQLTLTPTGAAFKSNLAATKFTTYLSSGAAHAAEFYGAVGTNPSVIIGNTNNYLRFGVNSSNEVTLEFLPNYSSIWTRAPLIQSYVTGGNVSNVYISGDNVILGGITTEVTDDLKLSDLTADTVPYLNASKIMQSSAVTSAQLGYLSNVTSDIQAQLNSKEGSITPGTTAQYWRGDKSWQTLDQAAVAGLTTADSPTLTGMTLSGLTANRLTGTNGSKALSSVSISDFITGTANQVTVADDTDGTATLSLPQNIATGSSPIFAGLNLSGLTVSQAVVTDSSKNLTSLQYTNANTASTLVSRDASGDFSAGTITAALTGSATEYDGVAQATYTASLRANNNIVGGGTITVDASGYLKWSQRFIVISNGRGSSFSTSGYFDITCPTSGTITGVGGASDRTATTDGIQIALWEAIYYILPIGSTATSLPGNFRVAYFTGDLDIPYNWVLIAVRNENGMVYISNGTRLPLNSSIITGTYDARRASISDALTTARTIGGVSFDATADIVPQTIQTVNETGDSSCFLLFGNNSGTVSQQAKTNTGLTYNSTNGVLGSGWIRTGNGSYSSPAHSFTNFTNVGMYAVASNDLRFALNGADEVRFTSANSIFSNNVIPGVDSTHDLGSDSVRWSTAYADVLNSPRLDTDELYKKGRTTGMNTILVNGTTNTEAFINFRKGGGGSVNNAGIMLSSYSSSHWLLYNENNTLRFGYSTTAIDNPAVSTATSYLTLTNTTLTSGLNIDIGSNNILGTRFTVNDLMQNQAGSANFSSNTFTYQGGTIMITVSGSCYSTTTGTRGVTAYIRNSADTTNIHAMGAVKIYINTINNHTALVPNTFLVGSATLTAGTPYRVRLEASAGTLIDADDPFNIKIVEFPF